MEKIHAELINAYRQWISERYDPAYLRKHYDLPPEFTDDRINQLREFFLEYVYPSPEKREELNAAFEHLDNHIKYPQHLLRILLDSGALLFKYGRHLPKIMKAGLKALRSFRQASAFEERLAHAASLNHMSPPFDSEDVKKLLRHLSRQEVEKFITDSEDLFKVLYDRKLVARIKSVVEDLIEKMERRPEVYSPDEVLALKIGRDIIVHGDALFEELSKKERDILIDFILSVERSELEKIFSAKQEG